MKLMGDLSQENQCSNSVCWEGSDGAMGGVRETRPTYRRPPLPSRGLKGLVRMNGSYKVTGIDLGDTAFQLGNCLIMHRSRDLVNTPGMYAKIRGSAMGWMNSPNTIDELMFFDELFESDVVLDWVVPDSPQQCDAMEGAVLVAALLIAFPDARFGFGLPGGETSIGLLGHYRSLGNESVDLRNGSEDRGLLTQLFNYLQNNSYWVDDDLVHMLALLTDLCQDRDRITRHTSVLSLSTSGNHQVDPGLFHAYQLIEALLEIRDSEPLREAVARWNCSYAIRLNSDQIDFIRNLRDIALHFKAPRADRRLKDSQIALGFDRDIARQNEFRRHGIQKLLREAAQAFLRAHL